MSTFNRVVILGILGHEPLLQQTRNQKPYCRLSLATHSWKKEGAESATTWHKVHVFGKEAERVVQYLHKGRSVLVEGRFESTKRVNSEGKEEFYTWIRADHVTFVGGRSTAPQGEPEPFGEAA